MKIDISTLVNDKKFPSQTSVKINKNYLEITFPSGGYKLIPEFSEIKDEGKTWAVYISEMGGGIAAFTTLKYEIPPGIEKVILKDTNF